MYTCASLKWLATINKLPDNSYFKHLAYRDVHSGVDIFHNLGHIPIEKARKYRDKGKKTGAKNMSAAWTKALENSWVRHIG